MKLHKRRLSFMEWIDIPAGTIPDSYKTTADLFQELAERGRFDEDGGELSDEDWADSQ